MVSFHFTSPLSWLFSDQLHSSNVKIWCALRSLLSVCRGCGFVQFPDERLQKRALDECQGAVGLGSKPLRLSLAANK